jgi:hypothetical protein
MHLSPSPDFKMFFLLILCIVAQLCQGHDKPSWLAIYNSASSQQGFHIFSFYIAKYKTEYLLFTLDKVDNLGRTIVRQNWFKYNICLIQ